MHTSHPFIHLFSPLDSADYWKEVKLSRLLSPLCLLLQAARDARLQLTACRTRANLRAVGLQSSTLEAQLSLT